jgi:hypothetical protein
MSEGISGAAPNLPSGPFAGRDAFAQLVRDALACAAREGWREIALCDASFEDWPLGERAVAQSLQDWSSAGRRCVLLARRYDEVVRRHARFVEWRGRWSHLIDARACPGADALELPSAIMGPKWMLHRVDPEHSRGVCGDEPSRGLALCERVDAWLSRSAPGFPAVTLGL